MSSNTDNPRQNTETTRLLSEAKCEIDSSIVSLLGAAQIVAAAEAQDATAREIAIAVGRSVRLVNRLSRWLYSQLYDPDRDEDKGDLNLDDFYIPHCVDDLDNDEKPIA